MCNHFAGHFWLNQSTMYLMKITLYRYINHSLNFAPALGTYFGWPFDYAQGKSGTPVKFWRAGIELPRIRARASFEFAQDATKETKALGITLDHSVER
jgi:hypothetical protein